MDPVIVSIEKGIPKNMRDEFIWNTVNECLTQLSGKNLDFVVKIAFKRRVYIKRGKKMKHILKGNKAWGGQCVMKNSKKKILLNIVIDVKYLKAKEEKRDEKISTLWFLG